MGPSEQSTPLIKTIPVSGKSWYSDGTVTGGGKGVGVITLDRQANATPHRIKPNKSIGFFGIFLIIAPQSYGAKSVGSLSTSAEKGSDS
jgi:hypothetical protein